jgi:tetratricopeptide (TPR) repeat protein
VAVRVAAQLAERTSALQEGDRARPDLTTTYQDYFLSTLQELGDVNEALAIMEAAHTVDPQSLDVRRTLAHAQMNYGLYSEAIANLEEIRRQERDVPFVDMLLGRALTLAGRPADGIPLFEKDKRRWWGYLGYAYAISGRADDAARLVDANPDKPARLALVYAGLGRPEDALDALEATAKIHPIRAAVTLNLPELRVVRDSGHPRLAATSISGCLRRGSRDTWCSRLSPVVN